MANNGGLITRTLGNVFDMYEGYKDFQQRQQKQGLSNLMDQLSANQSLHPGDTSLAASPDQIDQAKKYGIDLNNMDQSQLANVAKAIASQQQDKPQQQPQQQRQPQAQEQPDQPQPVQTPAVQIPPPPPPGVVSSPQPAMVQQPQQQSQNASAWGFPSKEQPRLANVGQQMQPERQQRRINYPTKGFATLNEQTGEVSPTRYIGSNVDLIKTNASPKGITWMVDQAGNRPPVQTYEGDPRAQQLAEQGYIPTTVKALNQKDAEFQQNQTRLTQEAQANRDLKESIVEGQREKPQKPNYEDNLIKAELTQELKNKGENREPTATEILDRKQQRAGAKAGEQDRAKKDQDQEYAERIVAQNHLDDRLVRGLTAPDDISQSFRQPLIRIVAVAKAMEKDPNFNEIAADANKKWYSTPTTQRLTRRTESIVTPGGAADESIRFAKLVDNPGITPLNRLTGEAKMMFGSSQRSLLSLVQGMSSEEIQLIMGPQGGGERFLEFTQSLNDPNQSVDQYVNNVNELKYLIYTRQAANVRGTPEQKKWEKIGEQFKKGRPFADSTGGKAGGGGNVPPDGSTSTTENGDPIIVKNGEWVLQ